MFLQDNFPRHFFSSQAPNAQGTLFLSSANGTPGAPLTYFNDGGGGGGGSERFFSGLTFLAKRDFFGSMKDAGIFLGCENNRGIFLGIVFFISSNQK